MGGGGDGGLEAVVRKSVAWKEKYVIVNVLVVSRIGMY